MQLSHIWAIADGIQQSAIILFVQKMNSGPGDLKDEASKNIKRYLGRHAVGFSGTRRMVSKKL